MRTSTRQCMNSNSITQTLSTEMHSGIPFKNYGKLIFFSFFNLTTSLWLKTNDMHPAPA